MKKILLVKYFTFGLLILFGLFFINMIWGLIKFPYGLDIKIAATIGIVFVISIFMLTYFEKKK